MGDFGTGLRAHLEESRGSAAAVAERVLPVEPQRADLDGERRRLEELAAQLAGKEFELVQREAELHEQQEKMALALARAWLQAAATMNVEPTLDELAVARARRAARR